MCGTHFPLSMMDGVGHVQELMVNDAFERTVLKVIETALKESEVTQSLAPSAVFITVTINGFFIYRNSRGRTMKSSLATYTRACS